MNPKEVMALCNARDVKVVAFHFCNFQGLWQSVFLPINELKESTFESGLFFDQSLGTSNQLEALVLPDSKTAFIDPFSNLCTLGLICDISDAQTRELHNLAPRSIAKKASEYLKSSQMADKACFGPEPEFFIFNESEFSASNECCSWRGKEQWNSGNDHTQLRNEMMMTMVELGIDIERHHQEAGILPRFEIDVAFDSLISIADKIYLYKYIVQRVAQKYRKTATFMPKPLCEDVCLRMNTHISLWQQEKNLMAGEESGEISETGLFFIGGLLKHAGSLCAFCKPSTNSYRNRKEGSEPVCRVPFSESQARTKRVEFRCADPLANPYLAFSAMLMAGVDGIRRKILPENGSWTKLGGNSYFFTQNLPISLENALLELEKDRDYLTENNIFSDSFLDGYIHGKKKECRQVAQRPHPYEHILYYKS